MIDEPLNHYIPTIDIIFLFFVVVIWLSMAVVWWKGAIRMVKHNYIYNWCKRQSCLSKVKERLEQGGTQRAAVLLSQCIVQLETTEGGAPKKKSGL